MRVLVLLAVGGCSSSTVLLPSTTASSPPTEPPATAGCAPTAGVEGDYVPQDGHAEGAGASCTAEIHAVAGAAGSVLSVQYAGDRKVIASAVDPGGREILAPTLISPGDAFDVAPLVTGEVLVSLQPQTVGSWSWSLDVSCAQGCDLLYTRYPVLLMHGLGGADSFDGVSYFYGVPEDLSAAGVAVAAPAVAPFASSATRAAEWEGWLDALLAQGHRRVNVVAHSQGGCDARILASDGGLARGDAIASITTIGTPHAGTPIADALDAGFTSGVLDPVWFDVGASVFAALYGISPDDPAFEEAVHQFTSGGMAELAAANPDFPGTAYASWAGVSCGVLEPVCQGNHRGEIVDPLLAASYLLMWPAPNDGMVPESSQVYGDFLGELPADHSDEIGQFEDVDNPAFDHLAFYRSEIERLREEGL